MNIEIILAGYFKVTKNQYTLIGVVTGIIIVIILIAVFAKDYREKQKIKDQQELENNIRLDELKKAIPNCDRCNKVFAEGEDKTLFGDDIALCYDCLMIVQKEQAKINHERMLEYEQRNAMPAISCPRCKSTQISADNKKLSVGRAVVGGALAGPLGAALGGTTSKQVIITCLNCGKQWKAGKG